MRIAGRRYKRVELRKMLLYDILRLNYGLLLLNGMIMAVVTYQLVKCGELERKIDRLESIESIRRMQAQEILNGVRVRDRDIVLERS